MSLIQSSILNPVSNIKIVERSLLKPNNYNPNHVNKVNLDLLKTSILANGWTLPIVVDKDYNIIDGFHRWTVAGEEPLKSMLDNKVPVVIVPHTQRKDKIYGTITHNRAKGEHQLEPMRRIIKELIDEGISIDEISEQLGMTKEEIFRLSPMTKDQFLEHMISDGDFSKAKRYVKVKD